MSQNRSDNLLPTDPFNGLDTSTQTVVDTGTFSQADLTGDLYRTIAQRDLSPEASVRLDAMRKIAEAVPQDLAQSEERWAACVRGVIDSDRGVRKAARDEMLNALHKDDAVDSSVRDIVSQARSGLDLEGLPMLWTVASDASRVDQSLVSYRPALLDLLEDSLETFAASIPASDPPVAVVEDLEQLAERTERLSA